jgi:hypothetical protein
MLWDLIQQIQLSSVRERAHRAGSEALSANHRSAQTSTEIAALRGEVDRLSLACHALWELLKQQPGFSDEILRAKIQELDLLDGKLDGNYAKAGKACPECGRTNVDSRESCMYCGSQLPPASVFP